MVGGSWLLTWAILAAAAALGLFVSCLIWRRRVVALRVLMGGIFLVVAVVAAGNAPPLGPVNRAAPVASGAPVYVVDPADSKTLFAVDGQTGRFLWQRTFPYAIRVVTVDAEAIVIAPYEYAAAGQVLALRATDGTPLWQFAVPKGEVVAATPVIGSTLTGRDVIYVPMVGDSLRVAALRLDDGAALWEYTSQGRQTVLARGVVATAQAVFLQVQSLSPTASTHLLALRAANGTLMWQAPLQFFPTDQGVMAADGTAVYFNTLDSSGYDYVVEARRSSDGMPLWQSASGIDAQSLVEGQGVIYAEDTFRVLALDTATGTSAWALGSEDVHSSEALDMRGIVVRGSTLYLLAQPISAGAAKEKVYAVDATTGAAHWTHTLNSTGGPGFVVLGDTVFALDDGLTALDAESGASRWHTADYVELPYQSMSPSAAASGVVFVASFLPSCMVFCRGLQGYLTALGERDGAVYWRVPVGSLERNSPTFFH